MENVTAKIQELISLFGMQVLAAVAIFIIGRWIAKLLKKVVAKVMTKSKVDPTLVNFTAHLTYVVLLVFVIVAAIGKLGIQTTSFIAIVGAAGLAIGLALQGSLANFAAGVLMLIFKPFKIGDYIEGGGVAGTVEEIQIFTTQLKTPDNKTVIVPNAKITSDNIINYSAKPVRRVDFVFGVSYAADIDNVKKVISDVLAGDKRVLKDPPVTVGVLELADSSVNFAVRPWVNAADYWGVYFDIHENMKKSFDAKGISIPFPQRDLHVYEHKGN